jgi:hypothetical protein
MVQISTCLSRFFCLAWPPASENGAATTMDENKPLMGRFLQWKASGKKRYKYRKNRVLEKLLLVCRDLREMRIPGWRF